jgi:CIC family chloride channel protein
VIVLRRRYRSVSGRWFLRLLRIRVWFAEFVRINEVQITLFWAGVIGFIGAWSSFAFRRGTALAHWFLTHQAGGVVESFSHLVWWERLLTPVVGGGLAGLTMVLGMRLARKKSSTDYMEAIVIGDGVVSSRQSLVKCTSALFSVASGGSIGREGPLVQLSAMLASLVGRIRRVNTVQLRVLVACGAAAGIASAYNAPIGGAMFVAEIILGSLAMETFGPLVVASVVATLTTRHLMGEEPLYKIPMVELNSNWEILPHLLLGLVAGLAAPWFLRLLRVSERGFSRLPVPVVVRFMLGGLVVGALAILHPEVCGNGYSVVAQILHGEWFWATLIAVFLFKLVATAATFGSGAVGGVFTPTLFSGACLGFVFGHGVQAVWPGPPMATTAFALVGMGAFLAATTQAPIMAMIMVFELTLDYRIILPLMLACVVAHYTCRVFEKRSIYSESLRRKGSVAFQKQLSELKVSDLMKRNPITVRENARFAEIAELFIRQRFNNLYVVDADDRFRGAVALHDIKAYLTNPDIAGLVIAGDLVRVDFPSITPEDSLTEALNRFSHFAGDRLPVTLPAPERTLVGSISKTDLILALSERAKGGEAPLETPAGGIPA